MHKKLLITVGVPLVLSLIIVGAVVHVVTHSGRDDGELRTDSGQRMYGREQATPSPDAMTLPSPEVAPQNTPNVAATTTPNTSTEHFFGKLESINTGCFADGECFALVDGKHITTTIGRAQGAVGTIEGVASFGELGKHHGEYVEVYAQSTGTSTYTLYGNAAFYIKLVGKQIPKPEVN